MIQFAENVRRLAPCYYVQTPNFWFPYEPHFRFVGFQYLPKFVRAGLLASFPVGYFERQSSIQDARKVLHHNRLLTTGQMRRLFPDAKITHEVALGLNKSIMATRE